MPSFNVSATFAVRRIQTSLRQLMKRFHHEQNRPDAGQYVKVNEKSMQKMIWKGAILRLLPHTFVTSTDVIPGPFDYRSLMLQDDMMKAKKNARTPVLINIQSPDMQVGGLHGPTDMDYQKIKVFYGCNGLKIKRGKLPGQWGPWGEWTPKECPNRCGIGFQQRFRWCNASKNRQCYGISTQTKQCDDCAGKQCRNLGGDRFCKIFANCQREYHVMYCRKFCKYCGRKIKNNKSDYYCMRFAKPHCAEAWAQKECPVTCPINKYTRQ
eukprot:gene15307-16884_t